MKNLIIVIPSVILILANISRAGTAEEVEEKWSGLFATTYWVSSYESFSTLESRLGVLPTKGCEWGVRLAICDSTQEIVVKSVLLKGGVYYYYEDKLNKNGDSTRIVTVHAKLNEEEQKKLPKIEELNKFYMKNKRLYMGLAHTQYVYYEWCQKRKIWLSEKMPQKKVSANFYDRIDTFLGKVHTQPKTEVSP